MEFFEVNSSYLGIKRLSNHEGRIMRLVNYPTKTVFLQPCVQLPCAAAELTPKSHLTSRFVTSLVLF